MVQLQKKRRRNEYIVRQEEIDQLDDNELLYRGSKYYTHKTGTDGLYLHQWLKKELSSLKNAVLHKDWDGVLVVDGMEGAGKSTIAQQIGGFLNPNMNLRNIVFTNEQFTKATEKAQKGDCIIWDETDFSSKKWMKKKQKALTRKLQMIRDKNLFLIFVVPYIFQLQKYLAISRSRALIHVVAKGFERGDFEFYGYNSKKMLYFKGKKYWNYNVIKHDWANRGKFTPGYYVPKHSYKKKKAKARDGNQDQGWTRDKLIKKLRQAKFGKNKLEKPIQPTQQEIADIFDLSAARIRKILKK